MQTKLRTRIASWRGIRIASSPVTGAVLLVLLALLTIWGTVVEVSDGLFAAHQRVFDSWVVLIAGFIPLPGVKLLIVLVSMSLVSVLLFRITCTWKKAGSILLHAGLLLLLAGGGVSYIVRFDGAMTLAQGESASAMNTREGAEIALPFSLRLVSFEKKTHPGTDMARSFESRVILSCSGVDREAVISMNNPLRYKDYTVYQQGYESGENGMISTLAVVKNPLAPIPYIASITISFGLLVHFMLTLIGALRRQRP